MTGPTKTKAEAGYKDAGTPEKRCAVCTMFRDGRCTLVQGRISPDAVCDYFQRSHKR